MFSIKLLLGKGLKDAGHFIFVVSHNNIESLVNSFGMDFLTFDNNAKDIIEKEKIRERIGKRNFITHMALMVKDALETRFLLPAT